MSVDSGRHTSWIGLGAIIAIVAVSALLFLPTVTPAREAARRGACQRSLKQWGMIFSMYAKEWREIYPRTQGYSPWIAPETKSALTGSPCGGENGFRFAPNPPDIFPEYATDFEILRCPSAPDSDLGIMPEGCTYAGLPIHGDVNFQYLGYIIVSDDASDPKEYFRYGVSERELSIQLSALLTNLLNSNDEAFRGRVVPEPLGGNVLVANGLGNNGRDTIYRMREAAARYLVTDNGPGPLKWRHVPVMWDTVTARIRLDRAGLEVTPLLSHIPSGANVLFNDGHVEFQKYSPEGRFPVNSIWPKRVLSALLSSQQ